jgi:methyl-accepting chemotaxis protein
MQRTHRVLKEGSPVRWFYNFGTMKKLLVSFGLVCLLMGIVGYMGVANMGKISATVDTIYQCHLLGISEVKEANINLAYIGRGVRRVLVEPDKAKQRQLAAEIDKFDQQLSDHLVKFEKTLITEEGRQTVKKLQDQFARYMAKVKEGCKLALDGKRDEAITQLGVAAQLGNVVDDDMSGLATTKEKLSHADYLEALQLYATSRNVLIGLIVTAVLVSVGLGYFVGRIISMPLRRAVDVLQAVAGGDYTVRLDVNTRDEVGQMATALNKAVGAVNDAMRQISEASSQVNEGSRVIGESAQTVAQGAQEQSSSVQEVTASIEELARSIQSVKDAALEADNVAKRTSSLADQGGKAVQQSVEAMELIKTSSNQIGEIIQVISEIAGQTNLLALNAAIEAARAGEHGMGFAVVADEVRKLAERSNQAAREISTLIEESTHRVEEGAQLSDQTGKSLQEIIEGVSTTVAKISEIATAAVQQAANAEEVSKAIQGIAHITEQSASGSEEMASSSEELAAQAGSLRELVNHFKINSNA